MKPNIKHLDKAARKAEAELDAAEGRSSMNAAARRLMRTRAELKAAKQQVIQDG